MISKVEGTAMKTLDISTVIKKIDEQQDRFLEVAAWLTTTQVAEIKKDLEIKNKFKWKEHSANKKTSEIGLWGQRRIQNPAKDLRWNVLRKESTAFSR